MITCINRFIICRLLTEGALHVHVQTSHVATGTEEIVLVEIRWTAA